MGSLYKVLSALLYFLTLRTHLSVISYSGFFAGLITCAWIDLQKRKVHFVSCIVGVLCLMAIPYLGITVEEEDVQIRNVVITIPKKYRLHGKNPTSVSYDNNPSIYVETTWDPKHNMFMPEKTILEREVYEVSEDVRLLYYQTTTGLTVLVRNSEQGFSRSNPVCIFF